VRIRTQTGQAENDKRLSVTLSEKITVSEESQVTERFFTALRMTGVGGLPSLVRIYQIPLQSPFDKGEEKNLRLKTLFKY